MTNEEAKQQAIKNAFGKTFEEAISNYEKVTLGVSV